MLPLRLLRRSQQPTRKKRKTNVREIGSVRRIIRISFSALSMKDSVQAFGFLRLVHCNRSLVFFLSAASTPDFICACYRLVVSLLAFLLLLHGKRVCYLVFEVSLQLFFGPKWEFLCSSLHYLMSVAAPRFIFIHGFVHGASAVHFFFLSVV